MDEDIWVEVQDKATKKIYYYNKRTRETTWSKPANFRQGNTSGSSKENHSAIAIDSNVEELEDNWAESTEKKTGKKYYYNKVTKETTWKKPLKKKAIPAETSEGAIEGNKDDLITGMEETGHFSEEPKNSENQKKGKVKRQRTGNVSQDGKWEEVLDPSNNSKYWYNRETKETKWFLPSSANGIKNENKEIEDDSKQELVKPQQNQELENEKNDVVAPLKDLKIEQRERPSERLMKLKQALSERESETMKKSREESIDDDDDDDDEMFEFRFAKHRHGFLNRLFRRGEVADEEQLLTFKKSLIKKALLKKNRDLDAECIQTFKNIMNYMGDRKSSKGPMDNARKLLGNAMNHSAGLRDEVYLQLCKQTNGNPTIESCLKGWELMSFCLSSFPPSKQLRKFLVNYFKNTEESDTDERLRQYSSRCLASLEKIITVGQRKAVPSTDELNTIRTNDRVNIQVYLVNGTYKTITVDAFDFVKDVEEQIGKKLNLTLRSPFALYQCNAQDSNVEQILDPKERVLDVYAMQREHALRVEESKKKVTLKKSGSEKMLKISEEENDYNQFVFKAKLVLKTADPDVMGDPEAVNLLYLQSIHDIITWRYPVKDKDITVLAALQLQATYGDYQKELHNGQWLQEHLFELMPDHLIVNKKGEKSQQMALEWEQKILDKYSKILGFTSLEAKLNYLDYVQEWPFYGATFFSVEQRQFKDYPSPLTIGITCEGVILMHPIKKTLLENYPYTDIVTWGHSDERFIVVVGNIVQQRKLIFKTKVGKTMNNLIHDYVKFKVKGKVPANIDV